MYCFIAFFNMLIDIIHTLVRFFIILVFDDSGPDGSDVSFTMHFVNYMLPYIIIVREVEFH